MLTVPHLKYGCLVVMCHHACMNSFFPCNADPYLRILHIYCTRRRPSIHLLLRWLWYRLAWLLQRPKLTALVAATHYLWALVQCAVDRGRGVTQGRCDRHAAHGAPPADSSTRADATPKCRFAQPVVDATWAAVRKRCANDAPPPATSLVAKMLDARHRGKEQQGRPLRDMEICAQAFTLLLGGYETTSTATALALFLLAQRPDAQARVAAEAAAVGLGAGLPGFDQLVNGMPWTTAVVKETLRLYPVGTPLVALVGIMHGYVYVCIC